MLRVSAIITKEYTELAQYYCVNMYFNLISMSSFFNKANKVLELILKL